MTSEAKEMGRRVVIDDITVEERAEYDDIVQRIWAAKTHRYKLLALLECARELKEQLGSWDAVATRIRERMEA